VLALVACGGSDERKPAPPPHAPSPSRAAPPTGLQAIVLRVPRTGGAARVFDFRRLDSAVWTSDVKAPAIARFLAFDEDAGTVVVVDAKGAPRRIELRTGNVSAPPVVKLTALRSADGASVYGVSATGVVTRLTPTDAAPWTLHTPEAARDVAPQLDGSLLIVAEGAAATTLWRVHPPATALLDTAVLPRAEHLVHAMVGDRAYFASDSGLQTVRTRDLQLARLRHFPKRVRAVAPTPSGDRVYVALDSAAALLVVDRYNENDDASVPLPGPVADLRMDPLGRVLLVRPLHGSDTAWVVAVGTDRVIGRVRTGWTADLPFVTSDGSIVVSAGADAALLDLQSLRLQRTVPGGARDFWIPLRWNGFRPRAPGLDQPVTFPGAASDSGDSILAAIKRSQVDSAAHAPVAAVAPAPSRPVVDSAQGRLALLPTTPVAASFTVQFAALLDRDSAQARATRITVDGHPAHVVPAPRGTATVYLVVLGPYASRAAAEAAGRASKQANPWIYAGAP
jgi:SPOR domain